MKNSLNSFNPFYTTKVVENHWKPYECKLKVKKSYKLFLKSLNYTKVWKSYILREIFNNFVKIMLALHIIFFSCWLSKLFLLLKIFQGTCHFNLLKKKFKFKSFLSMVDFGLEVVENILYLWEIINKKIGKSKISFN